MTSYSLPGNTRDDEDERRRRGLIWLWIAIIVVLLAGVVALIARVSGCAGETCGAGAGVGTHTVGGNGSPTGSQSSQSTSPHGAAASSVSIQVSGSERGGLAPGMSSPVVVSIANTGDAPARITSAGVSVGDASKACPASASIRVTRYEAAATGAITYEVAPGSAVRIPLTISMLDLATNQNACKNARFPLTFHATAQQG
jgi:hypothetical protein